MSRNWCEPDLNYNKCLCGIYGWWADTSGAWKYSNAGASLVKPMHTFWHDDAYLPDYWCEFLEKYASVWPKGQTYTVAKELVSHTSKFHRVVNSISRGVLPDDTCNANTERRRSLGPAAAAKMPSANFIYRCSQQSLMESWISLFKKLKSDRRPFQKYLCFHITRGSKIK